MASKYPLCLTVLFLIYSFIISPVKASGIQLNTGQAKHNFSGLIGDKDYYTFSLNASESMIIEVTQPNTDLKLRVTRLTDNKTQDLVFESSIPATTWLAEKVIINSKQCTKCQLQILPIEVNQNSGTYSLTSEFVATNTQHQYHKLLAMMTTASVQWFNSQHNQDALKEAIVTYQNIEREAKNSPHNDIYLLALYNQSQLHHLVGNDEQQEQLLENILALSTPHIDAITYRAMLDLGSIARHKKEFSKATSQFNNAFDLAEKYHDRLIQAKIIEKRSLIESDKGNYIEAIALSEQANQIYITEGDWHSSIKILIATGWYNYRQGNTDLALNLYQQALSYTTKLNLLEKKADVLTKIGTIHRHLGDLEQASYFINQALQLSEDISHSFVDGWSKQAKARILMDAGMFDLAEDWLNRALVAFNKVSSTTDAFNIYYFLGINHASKGDYQLAEKYHLMVLNFDKKSGNSYDIGTTYYRLAQNALSLQQHAKAHTYQQQALQLLTHTDDNNLLGKVYSQTAFIYHKNNNSIKANHYFELALSLQKHTQDTLGLIQTHYWLARTHAESGQNKLAVNTITKAINYIQSFQNKLSREDFKSNFYALQQQVSSLYIALINRTNASPIETLTIAESFRSQALSAKLSRLKNKRSIPTKHKAKRHSLHQQLQSSIVKYEALASPETRLQIARETRHIIEQLHEINLSSHSKPTYTQQEKTFKHEIKTLQQNLPQNSYILYFDTNKINSHVWLINHEKIGYYSLPSEAELSTQITNVMEAISQPKKQLTAQKSTSKNSLLKQLSNTLLKDISVELEIAQHITIIPDGPLHYLPFSILELPTNHQRLLEQVSISYAPSIGVLQQLNNKFRTSDNHDILIVANPEMTMQEKIEDGPSVYRLGFYSKELPYTQLEGNYIQHISPDNVTALTRDKATKMSLQNTTLSDFQILHFATHGIANSYQPSLGGLVLSNVSTNDNLLLSPEIINLTLNADLVMLSGCETAAGKLINGEGVFSLSRSFFAAGAKRVVASLWPVKDDATAKLMQAFYRYLLIEKLPIEEALQKAKLYVKNFKRNNHQKPWKDPYYWAGFVLQGPGGSFID